MAATFQDFELIPGRPPEDYFNDIKDILLTANSVEIIRHAGTKLFLRAWFGQRSDGSMAVNPTKPSY